MRSKAIFAAAAAAALPLAGAGTATAQEPPPPPAVPTVIPLLPLNGTDVTGTATLGGATVSVLAANGRYGGSTDYTILSAAGGLNGTFGSVTSNLAFLTPSLSYSGTDVTLTLARNDIDFAAVGANVNQKNVAAALESLGVGNAVFEEVLLLTDTSAQTGFQSATGELHPAVSSALVETNQTLRRQMLQAPSARANGAFGWGSMIGSFGGADATSNTTDLKTRTVGLMGGLGIGGGGFEARIGGGVTDDRFEQNGTADATSTFLIGQAGFDAQLRKKIGGHGRYFRRLTDHAVTGSQRGRDFPGKQIERQVPW